MDPVPRPTNAEMAQLVALLEERGLVEVYVNDDGQEVYRLTDEGVRVGNMLAMVEDEDADQVLRALLADESG
jgi:DNA-binding PadR family transcriptional regulator